jgi:hypothetical protein
MVDWLQKCFTSTPIERLREPSHTMRCRVPITPPEIRDKMVESGFDHKAYSQFLATIHVILKRLSQNGEATEFTFKDGKRYWWATNSMPGGPLPENAMLGNYYNSYRAEDLTSPLTYEEAKAEEAAKYRR